MHNSTIDSRMDFSCLRSVIFCKAVFDQGFRRKGGCFSAISRVTRAYPLTSNSKIWQGGSCKWALTMCVTRSQARPSGPQALLQQQGGSMNFVALYFDPPFDQLHSGSFRSSNAKTSIHHWFNLLHAHSIQQTRTHGRSNEEHLVVFFVGPNTGSARYES
jgi:hypothetical protein